MVVVPNTRRLGIQWLGQAWQFGSLISRCAGVVTLSEFGPIWTINQQAKSLKSLASTLAIVGKFSSV